MTRRDYVLLAEALKTRCISPDADEEYTQYAMWRGDCEAIADALAADNPRFDRARFLKAAGVQS